MRSTLTHTQQRALLAALDAERYLADDHPRSWNPIAATKHLTTVYRPYPVVGMITPWNYPFLMPGIDGAAALAAGAAVLLKPSEVTPLSGVEFARGWAEIGAPPILDVATGYGDTGAALIEQSDFVQFTGSTATGRKVAVACAQRLIPYGLELGGKDPAIVLADADLDRAANGIAWGGLFNSGQVCVSVERIYVEAPVYDEFVAKLTERVRSVHQGVDGDTGAMATEGQRDIVAGHVKAATAAGARVLTGGEPTGVGTFFEPTVLADVDQSRVPAWWDPSQVLADPLWQSHAKGPHRDYDAASRQIATVDPLNHRNSSVYDAAGRVIARPLTDTRPA